MENLQPLENLPLKNRLSTHYKFNSLIDVFVEKLMEIPEIEKLRMDCEFVNLVCDMIENTVKKVEKINKKDLALRVLDKIFTLSDEEKIQLGEMIEYLHLNKRIKKIKTIVWFGNFIKNLIIKKLL